MEFSDIKKSLSECSEEELREMLTGIRASRRTPRSRPTKQREKVVKTREKKELSELETLLRAFTPEQIADLAKTMGGK